MAHGQCVSPAEISRIFAATIRKLSAVGIRRPIVDKAASDSSETQRLLQAVRAGEPEALNRLFARHRDYLRKVIDMRLDARIRRRVDASDLVQETQIEAARRIEAYVNQPPMPFRLWLRKTARDRLNKARRRHVEAGRRSLDRELTLPDHSSLQLASRCLGTASTPSLHARRHELAGRIRQSIATLPEADRERCDDGNTGGRGDVTHQHFLAPSTEWTAS